MSRFARGWRHRQDGPGAQAPCEVGEEVGGDNARESQSARREDRRTGADLHRGVAQRGPRTKSLEKIKATTAASKEGERGRAESGGSSAGEERDQILRPDR